MNENSKDSNYLPLFEDEVSLGDEDFIVPEEPAEQECFKHQLIATSRSLKEKQRQLRADQDRLNDRWNDVLAAEEYGLERPTKSYLKRRLLPQFDDKALEPVLPMHNAADRPPRGWNKAAPRAKHQPALPRRTTRNTTARDIHMTCGMTWKTEQVRQDRSTNHGGVPLRAMTATWPNMTNIITTEPMTADELHPSYVTTWPDTEAPHTPSASLMK